MVRPPPLRPGDVVRVVAPSGPIEREVLDRGLAVLTQELGVEVRVRDDVTARDRYLAGSDARRLEEWREAVEDREARAIFCARGGYGAMRILAGVDPGPLLARPRWLVGFSDVTALHAVMNRAGLVTLHGPLVSTLARTTPPARRHLWALLGAPGRPPAPRGEPATGSGCAGNGVITAGRASGTLLGGSLTLLAHLCGTPFLPSFRGAVLVLEDVCEKPYALDRYLTQLVLSGALEGVRAVCVGHLTACDHDGVSGLDAVRAIVRGLGVPAIEGVPVGHEPDNHALPLGAPATVIAPPPGASGEAPRLVFDGAPAAPMEQA